MAQSVHIDARTLYGIQSKGPSSFNDVENSGADFGQRLWLQFIDELVRLGINLDQDMYGVSLPADEITPPQEIFYFCGIESLNPIAELESLELEGGNYFEYKCEVPPSQLDSGFIEAYTQALPASGLTSREGQHLEIYGEDYDPTSDVAKFTILIPVE